MKKLKVFIAMMIGIIAMVSSCKKDDITPDKSVKFTYGYSLDSAAKAMVAGKVYYLMVPLYDTVWPLDANGQPYKERNPWTNEWNFIEVKQTEKTVQQLTVEVLFEAVELLGQQDTRTYNFFSGHPMDLIKVIFPKNAKLLEWKTSDGKVFEQEISELNNVRDRLVEHPDHTLSQELQAISDSSQPTWKKASSEYFIDQVKNPSQKISAAKAKTIAAQINTIETNKKIDIVWEKVVDYHQRGIKPTENIVNQLANEL